MSEMTLKELKELELHNLEEQRKGAVRLIELLQKRLAKAEKLKEDIEALIKEAKEAMKNIEG